MSETREVLSRDKIPMILLTMVMSIVSIVKWIPVSCCAIDLGIGFLFHLHFLIFQKKVRERRANSFTFLHFFSWWAVVPNKSKVQKPSLKSKDIPTTNENFWYHFWSHVLHRGAFLSYWRKYIGYTIKKLWEVVKYCLSLPFPTVVIMSSKVFLVLAC